MGTEYIIVGDTEEFDECLVALCGTDFEKAKEALDKMINDPDEHAKELSKGHKNLRLKEVKSADCWWNDPVLAN